MNKPYEEIVQEEDNFIDFMAQEVVKDMVSYMLDPVKCKDLKRGEFNLPCLGMKLNIKYEWSE